MMIGIKDIDSLNNYLKERRMLNRSLILMFLILLFSCQNEASDKQGEVKGNGEANLEQSIEYYLDGERMEEGRYKALDDRFHNVVSPKDPKNPDPKHVIINAFTTVDKYVAFGLENGMPLDKTVEFETAVENYIQEHGIEQIYEETGELPQHFLDFQDEYYNRLFPKKERSKKMPSVLYKDYFGGPAWVAVLSYTAVMAPGWNNTVSRYYHLGIYGLFSVYDKWAFRNRMATLWGWGWNYILFSGPLSSLNNRTSSCISI
jgi:hypothetical protein